MTKSELLDFIDDLKMIGDNFLTTLNDKTMQPEVKPVIKIYNELNSYIAKLETQVNDEI